MKTATPFDKQMMMMQQLMEKMNKLEKELEHLKQERKEEKQPEYNTPDRNEQYTYRGNYFRGRRPYH
jgi:tetrahydromethanopterin S-methyltransferase subunit B